MEPVSGPTISCGRIEGRNTISCRTAELPILRIFLKRGRGVAWLAAWSGSAGIARHDARGRVVASSLKRTRFQPLRTFPHGVELRQESNHSEFPRMNRSEVALWQLFSLRSRTFPPRCRDGLRSLLFRLPCSPPVWQPLRSRTQT